MKDVVRQIYGVFHLISGLAAGGEARMFGDRKDLPAAFYRPNAGICFEPLEPRLLLSGSWGTTVASPDSESQSHSQEGLSRQSLQIDAGAGIFGHQAQNHSQQLQPGAIDLLIGVFDQEGKSRLDSSDRNDAANGVFLLRELAIKDALRSGPFGLMATGVKVENVRWTFVGGIDE